MWKSDLREEILELAGTCFRINTVANIEGLFDRLLSLPVDHPDVKDERIPYWAELWPSAIALAQFVMENEKMFAGKSVLEIGCGLALPGIAAGKLTKGVIMSDYLQEALEMASVNWSLNHDSDPKVLIMDWRNPDPSHAADILLASDVAYERRMFDFLPLAFHQLVKPGGKIIVSEPDRHYAREFFSTLASAGFFHEKQERLILRNGIYHRVYLHLLQKN